MCEVIDCVEVTDYPGSKLGAKDVMALADQFREIAQHLLVTGKGHKTKTCAPFRLVTIHAIELYLNAYLLEAGHDAATIRGLQHNLAKRAELLTKAGMVLRKRTVAHLQSVSANREYLVSRYDLPDDMSKVSIANQLISTMEEVRKRVVDKLEPAPKKPRVLQSATSVHSSASL